MLKSYSIEREDQMMTQLFKLFSIFLLLVFGASANAEYNLSVKVINNADIGFSRIVTSFKPKGGKEVECWDKTWG